MSEGPRIILFDLETLPNVREFFKVIPGLGAYPGLTIKASINSVICFGYKVFGEKETKCVNAWDYKARWEKDVNDDYWLVKRAADVLKTADVVVTHNGKKFDWKFLQTRLLHHGLPPLPKIIHIDTKQECKKHLLLFNNKLDTAAKEFTNTRKMEHDGWEMWEKVWNRDSRSMQLMTKYCVQDVKTLEKVFVELRPLITLPNQNVVQDSPLRCCPNCGNFKLKSHGQRHDRQGKKYQLLRCFKCLTFSKSYGKGVKPL